MSDLSDLMNIILFSKASLSYEDLLELKAAVEDAKKRANDEELQQYYKSGAGNILGQGLVIAEFLEKNK